MNDPDRWHTSDRFDDDAVFADIIAHMNDDVAEIERTVRPPADGTTGENVAPDAATEEPPAPETDDATGGRDLWPGSGLVVPPQPFEPTQPVVPTPHVEPTQPLKPIPPVESTQPVEPTQPEAPLVVPASQVWRAHEVDDGYEEHFEPPPTAPLPVGDLQFWGIIAGMGGGPLLLLYLVFFNRNAGSYWLLAAIAMSVGGFALLVSRLPGHHEDDDDGARL